MCVEQGSATQKFFAQFSGWILLGTVGVFVFGYCFEESKFSHLGVPDMGLLSTSDIFGVVRDHFLEIAVIGAFWVLLYARIFHGFLPKPAKHFAQEVLFRDGPLNNETSAAAKKVGDAIAGVAFGALMLLGIAAAVLNAYHMTAPKGSAYQAIGLSVIGLLFGLLIFSAWFEAPRLIDARLFRIFLTASLAASILAVAGSFAGQYDAERIMSATSPNVEIQLEDGRSVQGVIADILAAGYLIRTRDGRRTVFFEHSEVKWIGFLPAPMP